MTNLKNFLKAPLAPIYTNFEGGASAGKKAQFFGQNFEFFKKRFFWPVFQFFACGAEILTKTGSFMWLRRTRKLTLVDLKKVDKFF